jgi:hypothetical protein
MEGLSSLRIWERNEVFLGVRTVETERTENCKLVERVRTVETESTEDCKLVERRTDDSECKQRYRQCEDLPLI